MAIPAKLSIGRETGNDVVVDHPSVSRKHAEMVRNEDGSVDIFDTTSSVGTYALHEGRWIKFQHATVGPDETGAVHPGLPFLEIVSLRLGHHLERGQRQPNGRRRRRTR